MLCGFHNLDGIGDDELTAELVLHLRVEDLNLHTDDTLLQWDVTDGTVDEVFTWFTRGKDDTFVILLCVGTLLSKLTSDTDFTATSTGAKSRSDGKHSGLADWYLILDLYFNGVGQDSGRETAGQDLVAVDSDSVQWETKALGYDGFDLVDVLMILAVNHLWCSNANCDLDVVE